MRKVLILFLAATSSSRSGSVLPCVRVSVMIFSNMLYKSKGVQERLCGPSGVMLDQVGSNGIKRYQKGSSGVNRDQKGSSGV
jgi:hypothetical protein